MAETNTAVTPEVSDNPDIAAQTENNILSTPDIGGDIPTTQPQVSGLVLPEGEAVVSENVFETERRNGYEPAGRVVFCGYGREVYDTIVRDEFVEDAAQGVKRLISENGYSFNGNIDPHKSLLDNADIP